MDRVVPTDDECIWVEFSLIVQIWEFRHRIGISQDQRSSVCHEDLSVVICTGLALEHTSHLLCSVLISRPYLVIPDTNDRIHQDRPDIDTKTTQIVIVSR